jgi:peptide/nickel transport system ATP-binding protein
MLLEARNPVCCYKVGWHHKTVAIKGSLKIDRGQNAGILGQSGAGKTTLALMLAGLQRPCSGKVFFENRDIYLIPPSEKKRFFSRVQMVVQHPQAAFDPRWIMERSLKEPYRLHGLKNAGKKIAQLLDDVDLGLEVLSKTPGQLSGGELQRLAVARALSLGPDLLILDEPTSMLDMLTQARILNLLLEMQKKSGFAMLLISHEAEIAAKICDHIYKMEDNRLFKV